METYDRWEPIAGVATPCAEIVLHADPAAVSARLRFALVRGAPPRDLLLRFGADVVACMSHDEAAHPASADSTAGPVPVLGGAWAGYAFPLLVVRASRWLASFGDSQILDHQRAAMVHYRLVSLDNTVDVLTLGRVTAEWVPPAT